MSEPVKKPSDLLVVVNPKERQEALVYIEDRLKTLHVRSLPRLQELVESARAHLAGLQQLRDRLAGGSSPAARVHQKLHDAAMSGTASIVSHCNRAVAAKVRQLKEMKRELVTQSGGSAVVAGPTNEEIDAFLVACTEEEEAHALEVITKSAEELEVEELRRLRDACQKLIAWWESDAGQADGLRMNQYGNVNSAQGRVAIREARDRFHKEIFTPLRGLFRDLNALYLTMLKGNPAQGTPGATASTTGSDVEAENDGSASSEASSP